MQGSDVRTFELPSRPGVTAVLSLVLAIGLLLGPRADSLSAQEQDRDSIPHYNLDSLVVSVLRTPVPLGESAYPISVVGERELLQGKTGMFLEESLQGLPGVQVHNRYNYAVGERVSIRGFGARAQFGVRGIQIVVDGIPATLPDGQSTIDHLDLGSLGRVEALRGPASALYGNSSGGVLRFESQAPATVPIREEATIVGGSDGLLRLQSLTSGTAGQTGYLFNVDRLSYDGFREADDGSSYGAADRLHLNGRVERPLAGGSLGVTLNFVDLDAENPGSIDGLADGREEINDFVYLGNGTGKELQQGQLGVRWSGPVSGLNAEALVYGVVRDFQNPIPFNYIDVGRWAGGARLSVGSPDALGAGDFRWRTGVEWDIQDDDRREFDNDGGSPTGDPNLDQGETVQSVGLFAQGMVPLSERFDVVAGLRYDAFDFEVDDRIPTPTDDSGSRDMDSVSPSVGIHLSATDDIDVYANYSTFFETPTTSELGNREEGSGGFNPDLEPQDGWTVEMGTRGTLADRVSYELTFFNTELTNELVQFEIPSEPGVNYFRNAGESSRFGVETVVRAELHERLTSQLSYTYVDAQFDDYVVDEGGPGETDYSGNQVPGLAPNNLQGSLRYRANPGYLEVTADYRDEIPVNDANEASTESYTLFDARVGAEDIRLGAVSVSPFAGVRNITDELYSASVAVNAFGGRFYEPGPGRTFYVGLTTGFGNR